MAYVLGDLNRQLAEKAAKKYDKDLELRQRKWMATMLAEVWLTVLASSDCVADLARW